ncbi:MAG: ribosome silencing factor [Candidatus Brocadiaceae bacterium]|nr:ribosome silencing factor [Candidatus Brocadiaceae bacterium]
MVKTLGGKNIIDTKKIAIECAKIADDMKAEDICILDVRGVTFIAEYFVICSGFNEKQLQSITNAIETKLRSYGLKCKGLEGYTGARWILMDYGNIIVHLFDREMRRFYDLDLLWGDAPRLEWNPSVISKHQ